MMHGLPWWFDLFFALVTVLLHPLTWIVVGVGIVVAVHWVLGKRR